MSYKFRFQRLCAISFLFLGILCLVIFGAYFNPYFGIALFAFMLLNATGIWSYGLTLNERERNISFNKLGFQGHETKKIISDKDIEYWYIQEVKGSTNPLHWLKFSFTYEYFVCKIKNGVNYIYPLNHPYLKNTIDKPIKQLLEETLKIKSKTISNRVSFLDRFLYDSKYFILSMG